ncbi:MAG: YgiT-type zinc finger protein [Euryarchaeota archaeon]|nr:YgiT-type zinc finger protein [Euryarchaeota archaeon]
MKNCPSCGKGALKRSKTTETMYGIELGRFPADVCGSCGESFVDETVMKAIEARAKDVGVWGLGRKLKISRSGNSLVVRVPADVAKFLNLEEGQEVYVHPEGKEKLAVEIG